MDSFELYKTEKWILKNQWNETRGKIWKWIKGKLSFHCFIDNCQVEFLLIFFPPLSFIRSILPVPLSFFRKICTNWKLSDILCVIVCRLLRTSRNHSLNSSAIDERSLDGLGADIRPVNTVLQSVVVHHGHVVDVRHSEGDDVVVVGVVDVHPSDLDLPSVQQELTRLCKAGNMLTCILQEFLNASAFIWE